MNEAKATRYQRQRRRADASALLAGASGLGLVALTPLGRALSDWAWRASATWPTAVAPAAAVALFATATVAIYEVSTLPWRLRRTATDGPSTGQSTARGWASAQGLAAGALVSWLAALAASTIAYLSATLTGDWWWVSASALAAVMLLAALEVGPHVLARLAHVGPLSRPDLARRVAAVADEARVPVAGVYEWDVASDSRASALITGIGKGRRVLVASDLVRHWSDDEVVVVVAHELGHLVRHDLARAVALNTLILTAGLGTSAAVLEAMGPVLGLQGAADLASLPLVALVAGGVWMIGAPIRHAQSRRQERHADAFALARTGQAGAFASALRRLSATGLVDERPSVLTTWLFHGHPPVAERVATAERYLRDGGRDG